MNNRTRKIFTTPLISALIVLSFAGLISPATAAETDESCMESMDVSIVLDRSGSMWGSRIATAKAGSDYLVSNLAATDRSGLVTYASSHTLDKSVGVGGHAQTQTAIAAVAAGGGTYAPPAIDEAHLDLVSNSRGVREILIHITDGYTNGDPVASANAAKASGIEVYVIGIGSNVNTAQLQAQASTPTSDYYFNPQTNAELEDIFDQLSAELGGGKATARSYAAWAGSELDAANTDFQTNYVNEETYPSGDGEAFLQETLNSNGISASWTEIYNEAGGSEETNLYSANAHSIISNLKISGPPAAPFLFTADALESRAAGSASMTSASATASGTEFIGADVNGNTLSQAVSPNTNISLGGNSFLVLNEQQKDVGTSSASLIVNAIHVYVEVAPGNFAELIVSHASINVVCLPDDVTPPPVVCDPDTDPTGCCANPTDSSGVAILAYKININIDTPCVECPDRSVVLQGVDCNPKCPVADANAIGRVDPCNICPVDLAGANLAQLQKCLPECPPHLAKLVDSNVCGCIGTNVAILQCVPCLRDASSCDVDPCKLITKCEVYPCTWGTFCIAGPCESTRLCDFYCPEVGAISQQIEVRKFCYNLDPSIRVIEYATP